MQKRKKVERNYKVVILFEKANSQPHRTSWLLTTFDLKDQNLPFTPLDNAKKNKLNKNEALLIISKSPNHILKMSLHLSIF